MKKPFSERFGDFMTGKGFYIVLFLCVAAIGISGYYLFSSLTPADNPAAPVAGSAQVIVTPTPASAATPAPSPEPPAITTTPRPAVANTPVVAETPSSEQTAAAATPAPEPTVTPAPSAPTVFTWPVKGETLTGHSVDVLAYDVTMGDWRAHTGLDIAASAGQEVLAAAAGTVIDVVQDDLMGTTVCLDHGGGLTSTYANLASVPTVEVGDTVRTGDVLGSVGKTAIAESALASHLHFEMALDGVPVDPADYLS